MGGYDEVWLDPDSSPDLLAAVPQGRTSAAAQQIAGNTPMEILSGGIAAASIASSAAAMILVPSNIVFAAGGLSCVMGPYAYWQQKRLTDVVALQQTQKALSEQVERLGKENIRLHENIVDLFTTVDRLEDVEQALDVITQTQGQTIEAFEEQVKDNRDVLNKMQSGLRSNILQNLLKAVIRSDKDGNLCLDDREVDDLIVRFRKNKGVKINEERFRSCINSSGGSIQSVMDIIRNLIDDKVSEGDAIFLIHE